MNEYLNLAVVAFVSATILPLGSEVLFLYYLNDANLSASFLWLVACIFNTLGSVVNFWLGKYCRKFENSRWFYVKLDKLYYAERCFLRYGYWSLLFCWLPIIGDGISLIAGIFKTPLRLFIPLVFIGKSARYGVLLWGGGVVFT
ncbi:DedA family protein [Marinomonas sp. 15G1-11]|uniref:DedA family protein n=1 Tax=Marinomonas phaeophyticola TaxID=3004091 RepID=A0ABT4JQL8_9GAMM|nr:YqaA family protein [Marinomonas sp. 15G1-11]MCZ2720687.1 DedA family protein [Marinomonas sp. 15G1-11]